MAIIPDSINFSIFFAISGFCKCLQHSVQHSNVKIQLVRSADYAVFNQLRQCSVRSDEALCRPQAFKFFT